MKDPKARQQILKNLGRCFNGLVKGHVGKKCRSSPQCQRRHHPSICEQNASAGHGDTLSPEESTDTNVSVSTLNPEAPPFISNSTTSAVCSTNVKSVLLQTAQAVTYNLQSLETRVDLRILLDSGSQRSYVTERARRKLNLAPDGKQKLSIAAFGSARGAPQVCLIVSVGILLKGYPSITMSLFIVLMICEPLVSQPINVCVNQTPKLAGLELADWADHNDRLELDILIGAARKPLL